MSRTDRDVTRVVQSWLEEGATALPDRVLDTVLDQLPATPQRRSWWTAWRRPDMNNYLRIGLAAAAVLVVAFIGYQLFAGSNVGGPGPVETPTPVPTPSAAQSPKPAVAFPPAGELAVGRHSMTLSGVPFSFEIPTDGWISNGELFLAKGNFVSSGAGFIFWTASAADNVFADPCARTPLSPPAGPSAAELAAAVSTVPGTDLVSGPSEVSVGGYPTQHVVITIPEDIGCEPNSFFLWEDEDNPGATRFATELGSTIYVWIIDVDGTLLWIDGETYAASGPQAEQEVRQIVDSIQFE